MLIKISYKSGNKMLRIQIVEYFVLTDYNSMACSNNILYTLLYTYICIYTQDVAIRISKYQKITRKNDNCSVV